MVSHAVYFPDKNNANFIAKFKIQQDPPVRDSLIYL